MLILIIILILVFGLGGGYYGHTRWGPGGGAGIGLGTILFDFTQNRGPMADYSGCRSCNTRGVFPAPSSCYRFLGFWTFSLVETLKPCSYADRPVTLGGLLERETERRCALLPGARDL